MTFELDTEDLKSLVKGITPHYNVFENPLVKMCGEWIGGFVDKWSWFGYVLDTLSEEELYVLYITCKNSWK